MKSEWIHKFTAITSKVFIIQTKDNLQVKSTPTYFILYREEKHECKDIQCMIINVQTLECHPKLKYQPSLSSTCQSSLQHSIDKSEDDEKN